MRELWYILFREKCIYSPPKVNSNFGRGGLFLKEIPGHNLVDSIGDCSLYIYGEIFWTSFILI